MSVAVHCEERRNGDIEKTGAIYVKISLVMNVKDIGMVLVSESLDWVWTWTERTIQSEACDCERHIINTD